MDDRERDQQTPADDKLEAGNIMTATPGMRKLDNFWYYHKWHVIIAAFFIVVITIGMVQLFTRPKYDTSIIYAAPYRFNNEERADLEKMLSEVYPKDADGNGKKSISMVIYQIYSEDEFEAEKKKDEHFEINRGYNKSEYDNFSTYIMTGETSVCILSPYLYGILQSANRLQSMSVLYPNGDRPAGAMEDGFGIRLSETDFYKYHPEAKAIPENAILCMLAPTVREDKEGKRYQAALDLYYAMADFKAKG